MPIATTVDPIATTLGQLAQIVDHAPHAAWILLVILLVMLALCRGRSGRLPEALHGVAAVIGAARGNLVVGDDRPSRPPQAGGPSGGCGCHSEDLADALPERQATGCRCPRRG